MTSPAAGAKSTLFARNNHHINESPSIKSEQQFDQSKISLKSLIFYLASLSSISVPEPGPIIIPTSQTAPMSDLLASQQTGLSGLVVSGLCDAFQTNQYSEAAGDCHMELII